MAERRRPSRFLWLQRAATAIAVSLLIALSVTCSPPAAPAEAPHPGCKKTIRYQLDYEFTAEESLLVTQSVFAWQEGSGRAVCFTPGTGGIRVHKATDPRQLLELAERGAKSDNVRPEYVVGLASVPDAWILSDKLHSEQDFYATSIHEVGHLLGLAHYEPEKTGGTDASGGGVSTDADAGPGEPSWMYPSIDRAPHDGSRGITDRDRKALLEALR